MSLATLAVVVGIVGAVIAAAMGSAYLAGRSRQKASDLEAHERDIRDAMDTRRQAKQDVHELSDDDLDEELRG